MVTFTEEIFNGKLHFLGCGNDTVRLLNLPLGLHIQTGKQRKRVVPKINKKANRNRIQEVGKTRDD